MARGNEGNEEIVRIGGLVRYGLFPVDAWGELCSVCRFGGCWAQGENLGLGTRAFLQIRLLIRSFREQSGLHTLRLQNGDSFGVEANEGFRSEPVSFVCNYAVGKVSPCVQHIETGLDGWPVHDDI